MNAQHERPQTVMFIHRFSRDRRKALASHRVENAALERAVFSLRERNESSL
jgi:hypothetical protein